MIRTLDVCGALEILFQVDTFIDSKALWHEAFSERLIHNHSVAGPFRRGLPAGVIHGSIPLEYFEEIRYGLTEEKTYGCCRSS